MLSPTRTITPFPSYWQRAYVPVRRFVCDRKRGAAWAAGDFNGDGRLDVAVTDFGASTLSILLQVRHTTNLATSGVTASQVSLTWTSARQPTCCYNVFGAHSAGPTQSVNLASWSHRPHRHVRRVRHDVLLTL